MPYASPRKTAPRPLDPASLRALALHYVSRYATTRHKLLRYLRRKVQERTWDADSPADFDDLAEEFVRLGYVNDEAFAQSRTSSLLRRGYGASRVRADLQAAGISADRIGDHTRLEPDVRMAAAQTFARRKRWSAFARDEPGKKARNRALAAMLRGGHDYEISRIVIDGLARNEFGTEEL